VITPETYLVAFFILLFAYFLRGITGFGSGLIAIPLLAHFLPLTFVVPLMLVLDLVASIVLSSHTRVQVRWDEVRFLLAPSIVGILAGSIMLVNLPREPLLVSLGLFVIFFGLRYVFNVHSEKPISRWWSVPTGLSGGLIGALFGTGGPPYVVYLSHRLHDKTQLRGTLSGLFLLDGAFRLVAFLSLGLLFQAEMLSSLLLGLPVIAIGLYLGNKVHLGITHRQLLTLIGSLLLLSGGSLLWKAWLPV
jgi:uncharacterized membrane protein YfcA